MRHFIIIIAVLGVIAVSVMRYWEQARELDRLSAAVLALESDRRVVALQLEEATQEIARLEQLLDSSTKRVAPINNETPQPQPKPEKSTKANSSPIERMAMWRAQAFATEVEEHIALNQQQRDILIERFRQAAQGREPPSDEFRKEVLLEVLGTENAGRYEQEVRQQAIEEQQRAIDEAVIVTSRRLSLNEAQEKNLRAALTEVDHIIAPKRQQMKVLMRDAMANHLGGEEAQATLKMQYDQIKTLSKELKEERDRLLFDKMSSSLSDEQRNALLQLQAE